MRVFPSAAARIHRTLAALRPITSAAAPRPLVGVIDMENKDGTVYTPPDTSKLKLAVDGEDAASYLSMAQACTEVLRACGDDV